jgi:general secretion pathway protein K
MRQDGADVACSKRGFVIVAVLWILVALSALAMIFSVYLSASAHALAVNDTSLQAEALTSASFDLAAYRLMLAGEKARPPRGSFRFRMNDADVLVSFTSEAARIDLNYAPKEVLAGLFATLGAAKSAAREDADRIVGWRTRPVPGSANEEEARYGALGYSPRQALFTHANELALVVGLPPALVERALPFVTVFNGSGDVDASIAAPQVIAALSDKTPNKSADPFADRASATGMPVGSNPPAPTPNGASSAKSPCYRIETTISFKDGRRTASEAVIALGDAVEPYRVLSWQDDVEPQGNIIRRGSSP